MTLREKETHRDERDSHRETVTLQALVYDILPSTVAVFSYAIGSRKLSANEQFFVGVQTVVSLLQITQIKQGVSFIAANKVYTSTNKNTIFWIEAELFYLPGVDASHVYVRALALGCFYSQYQTFRRVLTALVDKECPFSGVTKSGRVWRKVLENNAQNVRGRERVCVCVCVWYILCDFFLLGGGAVEKTVKIINTKEDFNILL